MSYSDAAVQCGLMMKVLPGLPLRPAQICFERAGVSGLPKFNTSAPIRPDAERSMPPKFNTSAPIRPGAERSMP